MPRQVILQVGDEIGGEACFRHFLARAGQQTHADFGQIIHHQEIDRLAQKLRYGARAIAPGARSATDADHESCP